MPREHTSLNCRLQVRQKVLRQMLMYQENSHKVMCKALTIRVQRIRRMPTRRQNVDACTTASVALPELKRGEMLAAMCVRDSLHSTQRSARSASEPSALELCCNQKQSVCRVGIVR